MNPVVIEQNVELRLRCCGAKGGRTTVKQANPDNYNGITYAQSGSGGMGVKLEVALQLNQVSPTGF